MNFHGQILIAKFCTDNENIDDLNKKLIFRKNEYLQALEYKKTNFFVKIKNDSQKDEHQESFSNINKILKKSYWKKKGENTMSSSNPSFILNYKNQRKKRIDLTNK